MTEIIINDNKQDNNISIEDFKIFINNIKVLDYIFNDELIENEKKLEIAEKKVNDIIYKNKLKTTKLKKLLTLKEKYILVQKIQKIVYDIVSQLTFIGTKKKNELITLLNSLDKLNMDELKEQYNYLNNLINKKVL